MALCETCVLDLASLYYPEIVSLYGESEYAGTHREIISLYGESLETVHIQCLLVQCHVTTLKSHCAQRLQRLKPQPTVPFTSVNATERLA